MQIKLEKNQTHINQLVEKFITPAEKIKAVYEQSYTMDGSVQTKVHLLTTKKIIYVEFLKNDAFIKCYPLHNQISYQIERQAEKDLLDIDNIISIKIRVSPDASIIFRFDHQLDRSHYITTLSQEKQGAYQFLLKLNQLLAEI